MADDTEIEVGLDLDSVDFVRDMNGAVAALQNALKGAQGLAESFKTAVVYTDALNKNLVENTRLLKEMERAAATASKDGDTATLGKLQAEMVRLKSLMEGQRETRDLKQQVVTDNKLQGASRAAAKNGILQTRTSDGRTLDDAQLQNFATQAAITAINTSVEQIAARIADATAKASERLIKTSQAYLEAQLNKTQYQAVNTIKNFSGEGLARSYLMKEIGDYSTNARIQSRFGYGINQLTGVAPSELPAVLRAGEEAQRRATQLRREADAEEKRLERLAKRQSDPDYAMAQERKDASVERRYGVSRDDLNVQLAGATLEERKVILRGLANDASAAADAEKKLAAAIAANEREAKKRAAPDFALQQDRKNQASLKTYGIGRDELDARLANKTLTERIQILANLRAEVARNKKAQEDLASTVKNAEIAARRKFDADYRAAVEENKLFDKRRKEEKANRPVPVQLSPQEKAQKSAQQGSLNRQAMLDLNGGADFFGFQARLAGNYMLFGGMVASATLALKSIGDLDDALKRFQAITETTNTEMESFRGELLSVAESSRFSVQELSEVAITLGQTGLAADEVGKVLPKIAQFATAAGTSLQDAVEVTTSILGAYGMEANRAGEIVNVFTGALNKTKLSMQQLSLGITYSANVAGDAGISFSELTAVIGGLAQAGIRSGSTIGTGMRQLIQELMAPSDKLKTTLAGLGISLADVDIKANGFTGVLENLTSKGFGTAEALQSLDLRAASAFSAMTGQVDTIKRLQESLLLSNAATEAAAKANESLYAVLQRVGNTVVSVLDKAFRPAVEASKVLAGGFANLLSSVSGFETLLPVVGSGFAAIATAMIAIKVGSLVTGFIGLSGALWGATAASNALNISMRANPIIAGAMLLTGIAAAAVAWSQFSDETAKATDRLDKLKTVTNQLQSRESGLTSQIGNVDEEIERLIARREKLNSDPVLRRTAVIEAQKAFGDLGLSVKANAGNVDELIEALRRLRSELQNQLPPILSQQTLNLEQQIRARQEEGRVRGGSAFTRLGEALPGGSARATFTGQGSIEERVRAAYVKAFGSDINPIIDALRPNGIDTKDAAGSASPLYQTLQKQMVELSTRRFAALDATGGESTPEIRSLEARISLLENLKGELDDAVARAQSVQGDRVRLGVLQNQGAVSQIRSTPDFQSLYNAEQNLSGGAAARYNAILGNTSLSPDVQRSRLEDLKKELQAEATTLTERLNAYRDYLKEDLHLSNEIIDPALSSIEESLRSLKAGTHAAAKDAQDTANKLEETFKRRRDDKLQQQVDNLLKQAENSRTQNDLERIQGQITSIMKEREEIAGRMEFLKAGAPTKINPELNAIIETAKEKTREQLDGYVQALAELKKKLADQILKIEDKRLDVRQDTINAEINELEKQLRDARTTPEKAKELIETINKLLDEAKSIAIQRANTMAQRDAAVGPNVAIPTAAANGTVAGDIANRLNSAGRGDMASYAINAAQIESRMNPNARNASGASGLFQFMPGTFSSMGGDLASIYDIGAQIDAFIKFTDKNVTAFKNAFGRDASDAEKFLMHNQGSAGGIALLKNGDGNVLDVLRPFYRDAETAAKAVTGNGGNLNMTAGEFANHVKGLLPNVAGQYVAGTSAGVIEQNRQNQVSRAETDAATRMAANQKAADEIRLRKERLGLTINEAEIQAQLRAARKGTNDATDMDHASGAADRVLQKVAELRDNAVSQLQTDTKFLGSSEDEKAWEVQKVTAQYRAQAEKEALENAKQMGDLKLRQYDKDLESLNALRQQQEIGVNLGTVAQSELDLTLQKIEAAERKRDLDGEEAAKKTEILEIEKAIKAITESGLGTEDQLIELQSRLNALKGEELALNQKNAQARAIQDRGPSYSAAMDTANNNFLKGRGLKNELGEWESDAVRFGKTWEDVLGSVSSSMDQFFEDWASGSMKAGEAFKKFGQSVISDLLKMASKAVTNELFKLLLGGGGQGTTGGDGGLFSWIGGLFGGGATNQAQGGIVGMAGGGVVTGGIPNRDSVVRRLMPEEYVVKASAVQAVGKEALDEINQMGRLPTKAVPVPVESDKGGGGTVNVWVVSPDQVPPPGPRDIVASVSDDIQRGGSIKQLIKQVAVGAL